MSATDNTPGGQRRTTAKGLAKRVSARDAKVRDNYVNYGANFGLGTDNVMSGSTYNFNPITRVRNLMEWMHRGSWVAGVAVDVVADDMTRAGVDLTGDIEPDDEQRINECHEEFGTWDGTNDTVKWARLYGGALGVIMIDGQDLSTPLRPETVGKGAYRGILALDRWMVDCSLNQLVTEPGPDLGLPKFYDVLASAPALVGARIHYSRCIRLEGIRLPYQQRLTENLWGISVLERFYDRLVAFDSATTGAAQLVYKSYIRRMKVDGLRTLVTTGGKAEAGFYRYMDMMRRFQSLEGIAAIDSKDDLEALTQASFSGLSDALDQFGMQLSGALQIPLVRLFGQSPGGLNASGESDLITYYDGIHAKQKRELKRPFMVITRCAAASCGVKLKKGSGIEFRPLWQIKELDKGKLTAEMTKSILDAEAQGVISHKTALMELKKLGHTTGVFASITKDDIESAAEEVAPSAPQALQGMEHSERGMELQENPPAPAGKPGKGRDVATASELHRKHGLEVVIENPKGSLRQGGRGKTAWKAHLGADYGYLMGIPGADGDDLDCFIGPDPKAEQVHVIDQRDLRRGDFDEHKVMLGFPSLASALHAYTSSYPDGRERERLGALTTFPDVLTFKKWVAEGRMDRPCSVDFQPKLRSVA